MCPVGPRPQGVAARSKSLHCLSAKSLCSVMSAVFCVSCVACLPGSAMCLWCSSARRWRRRMAKTGLEKERRKCRVSVHCSACVCGSVRTCSECIGRRKKSSAQRVARRNFLNVKLFVRRSFFRTQASFVPATCRALFRVGRGWTLRAAPVGFEPPQGWDGS